jgi:hypothetical protein
MRFATPPPRLRRALSFSGLAVVLAFTSLTLSQCRSVADRVTGVQPLTSQSTDCIDRCRDIYRISIIIENAIHQIKLRICGSNASCVATENARHTAVLAKIEQNRLDCLKDCHNQGAGGS